MKRLTLMVLAGFALWVGLGVAQQDPWWDPRGPSGQSLGITYGTNLPTLANTGFPPPEGLLAVQITPGSAPTLNMYDDFSDGWLPFVVSDGLVPDIDQGITALATFNPTLEANDNNNDQRNVLLIDVDLIEASTGGLTNAINVDSVTDVPATLDSAIMVEGGWDSAITIFDAGHAFSSNPLTGSVYITLDDSTDYSGGGGVDCWLVLRDANGTNHQIVQVALNGTCP